ncbi:SpoIIE family protein phosphatase [Streptomyces sp. NBC_01762]|uniref:SpoIIE family protein phosphatase n=1 Tax=unclassified Streptomyces TaxID=2593676 RepID=UPI002DDC02F4|nr:MULTISPECIES: SpoIIE family protein phosphatase [unclassified Streptomyces]WSC47972.1 SpoIIE family protein phosphatase [Streptomyces sp. NBC_01762]WSD27622.1 SpoIIE family protein phosphatase [Streptomyces sp. NBC_01751]
MDASDELLRGPDPAALLTLDGAIRSLNAAMATALGRPAEQCLGREFAEQCRGREFADLWPASQRMSAENLVAHAARTKTVAMRVLDLPERGGAPVACLIEARQVKDPASDEQLIWVHALDARNDLASLLIPFRMATTTAHLGLWMYSPYEHQLEWLGGAPALAALFPDPTMSLSRVISAVHPDDQAALRQLLRSASTQQSPWVTLRYLPQHEGWHQLAAQTRRIQLGYGGPERIFGVVRDDTKQEKRKRKAQAALTAERQRAKDTADFSSALITAATEQELQQVVLTRLAATFGATGALLALVDEGRLRVSTDAGIAMWEVDALHGMPLDHPSALPEAIRTGKPHFIPDRKDYIHRWPHGAEFPWLGRLGSDYATSITPLSEAGNQPLGGWLMTYGSGYRPSLDERTLMGTLADLAGQALRRIRLQQARVELATALQKTMLPTLPEHLAGLEVAARYRPSRDGLDIGGDWYDAFVMPDGAIALEIGDAQGHDVDAAALMGQVRLSMRAIAAQEPDPGTVLTRTNELFVTMEAARFASCTMLHVDPGDGQVTGASAGHVPVLCARDDGSHSIRELPGGPVLGVVADTEYREETFTLDEDSVLVMVTDGVVEGPGLTLEAGLERAGTLAGAALHEGLDAEETADRILDAAVAVDHLDDVAVLVIRRT